MNKHGQCYLSGAKNFEFYPVCAAEPLKPFKKGESMFHKGHWLWEGELGGCIPLVRELRSYITQDLKNK